MSFKFIKNNDGTNHPVIEELPVAAGTYNVGDALGLDSTTGYVKKITGTAKPDYISAACKVTTTSNKIAMIPVTDGQIYKTKFSADGSALKAGAKVTIDADSIGVTATTTSGVFTLLEEGKASGGTAIGKF